MKKRILINLTLLLINLTLCFILIFSSVSNCFALSDEIQTNDGSVKIYQLNDNTVRISNNGETAIIKQESDINGVKTTAINLSTGDEYYFINDGNSIYSSITGKSIPLSEVFDNDNTNDLHNTISLHSADKFVKTHKIKTAVILASVGVAATVLTIVAFIISSIGVAGALVAILRDGLVKFLEKVGVGVASALTIKGDYLLIDEYEGYRYATKNGKQYKLKTSHYKNFRFA